MMNVNELSAEEAMEPRVAVNSSASIVTMIEHARMDNRRVVQQRREGSRKMVNVLPRLRAMNRRMQIYRSVLPELAVEPVLLDFEDFATALQEIDQVANEALEEAMNGNFPLAVALAPRLYDLVESGHEAYVQNQRQVYEYQRRTFLNRRITSDDPMTPQIEADVLAKQLVDLRGPEVAIELADACVALGGEMSDEDTYVIEALFFFANAAAAEAATAPADADNNNDDNADAVNDAVAAVAAVAPEANENGANGADAADALNVD